ncbi:MAG: S8 family serine peptidase, partial [Rhodospirillales bacterium]|nr:S8 family serine peptidase [Acetobacter sp.]
MQGDCTVGAERVCCRAQRIKPDIFEAHKAVLPDTKQLTPVRVAIWDSGIDLKLFPGRLYTNPATPADEDPNGIAFDVHDERTHGALIPLTAEQERQYPDLVKAMEGLGDLQSGVDTPAADALKAKLASMPAAQARAFIDNLEILGGYAHGTHVTGIAARGNPVIQLAYSRMTYDNGNPHQAPSEEHSRKSAASFAQSVTWFKEHGIRVVNMSWWDRPSNFEKDLADNGIGKDDAERKVMARHLFGMERDALFAAIQGAPDILFVTIAGNNDANNAFEECIPSSFVLPNLIVVGAVDQAGDETGFTSYGSNVAVDANGFAVPSVVPGGAVIRDTGTSMAAPQVTNLAAKLLAVDPRLTPPEVTA